MIGDEYPYVVPRVCRPGGLPCKVAVTFRDEQELLLHAEEGEFLLISGTDRPEVRGYLHRVGIWRIPKDWIGNSTTPETGLLMLGHVLDAGYEPAFVGYVGDVQDVASVPGPRMARLFNDAMQNLEVMVS
mgnify:FL=1